MKVDRSYEDILCAERPESRRPRMSLLGRAAQFAPFAALSGLDDTMDETGRYEERIPELSEDEKELLDYEIRGLLAL